ncbi:ATP-binding protein [Flavobacterium cucumis]|uniref:histidine kinase n=1 Tax=Flavobacterium cucumis TaxID=416016 RepID=A0A1M7ZX55_9FLAO|nr:GAF domain-containing sensor histidine kinase [Flavobacterium cucumis]SHO73207.1 GAF sensor signal transduction histidine kinase [Flavobacterium cucumis]
MSIATQEALRSRVLDAYQILDTLPEAMYDDITAIASAICNMPISLISLVDDKRQFFKSHHGIDLTGTPIEYSVCYHAIMSDADFFAVNDLRIDERFRNNPLVTQAPNLVSYYGVPLSNDQGISFGTLCVLSNNEVLLLGEEQKEALKKLSRQVVYLLELRKKNLLLESYQQLVDTYAADIEDFAYTAAHDLRSPLRSITSFLKLIESGRPEEWSEKEMKYFKFVFDNVGRMDALIVALLNFAKSDKDLEDVESINLEDFVPEIFNSLCKEELVNAPKLIHNTLPTIEKSKLALTLIFSNLIENALKYQKPNVVPEVSIQYSQTLDQHVFDVSDNGIGIEESHFETILKPFRRLHAQSEFAGTGLGLATVKKHIDRLKGTITVRSQKDIGTTFTIAFPK